MTNGMVDIETLGQKPGCVILSIGATVFDPRGNGHGETFYCNVDPKSCEGYGLTVDPETVKWWAKQTPEAQEHLKENQKDLIDALYLFDTWWKKNGLEKIWCQGATFDAPILQAAYESIGWSVPWKFWNVRDTRTVYDIRNFNPYSVQRNGTYHNALDDAAHQVVCVQKALS